MAYITKTAIEVIEYGPFYSITIRPLKTNSRVRYVKNKGLEIRFSSEDSFRSDLVDLLTV